VKALPFYKIGITLVKLGPKPLLENIAKCLNVKLKWYKIKQKCFWNKNSFIFHKKSENKFFSKIYAYFYGYLL